jgi:hypothetical protein
MTMTQPDARISPNMHRFIRQNRNAKYAACCFHPNTHAFTALQALNWGESLTNFQPNLHAAERHKTG